MEQWFEELAKKIEQDGGCREIHRFDSKGDIELYLKRYYISKTPNEEAMLHQFFKSDVGDLHDHPWDSHSIILKTGYYEWLESEREQYKLFREPGHFGGRLATDFHKIELVPGTEGNVWTLFTTGKRIRKWGYKVNEKWVPFDKYHEMKGIAAVQVLPTHYTDGLFPKKIFKKS